ncbi:MAG: hypothetical protein GW763_11640 [Paraglaciecola sp.]|nr:hypothetical protein [Paraglaciecola sp.]NCT48621.1 hypothetical protein [Paraglaciecola sp.]
MQTHILHQLRHKHPGLKYALVAVLLWCFALGSLAVSHKTEHFFKADTHCAMCIASLDLEHSSPAKLVSFASSQLTPDPTIPAVEQSIAVAIFLHHANRGPPIIS